MNSTPRDSVDLPDAESPASASSTGRSPASRADTLGAIKGTEPSDMRRERPAVVLGGDTATLAQNPSGGTLIGTEPRGSQWETTRNAGTTWPRRSPSTASARPRPPGRAI